MHVHQWRRAGDRDWVGFGCRHQKSTQFGGVKFRETSKLRTRPKILQCPCSYVRTMVIYAKGHVVDKGLSIWEGAHSFRYTEKYRKFCAHSFLILTIMSKSETRSANKRHSSKTTVPTPPKTNIAQGPCLSEKYCRPVL